MIGKTPMPAQIRVLAGVNGAGKSSIVGATIRDKGGEYYNPDEAAREIMAANPGLGQTEANAAAFETSGEFARALAQFPPGILTGPPSRTVGEVLFHARA